jgi:hypothetical protein
MKIGNLDMTNTFMKRSKGYRLSIRTKSGKKIFRSSITDNIVNGN